MAKMCDVTCPCGKVFQARTADVDRGWGKFCSKACKSRKHQAEPLHPHNDGLDDYRAQKPCAQCGALPGGDVAESTP